MKISVGDLVRANVTGNYCVVRKIEECEDYTKYWGYWKDNRYDAERETGGHLQFGNNVTLIKAGKIDNWKEKLGGTK